VAASSASSHQVLKSNDSFKSADSHLQPQKFTIHTPRFNRMFGPDIQPEILFQQQEQEQEIQEAIQRQEERKQHIITELRHHQNVKTTVDKMVKPDVDMKEEVDELMQDVNRYASPILQAMSPEFANATDADVFTGVFTKNIFKKEEKKTPTKEKKEKREKKEKEKKSSVKRSIQKEKVELESSPKSSPKANANDDSDEVELQHIILNDNKTMKYWRQQSANEIKNQLRLRKIPSDAQWFTKKGLLKIVSQLIKDKNGKFDN